MTCATAHSRMSSRGTARRCARWWENDLAFKLSTCSTLNSKAGHASQTRILFSDRVDAKRLSPKGSSALSIEISRRVVGFDRPAHILPNDAAASRLAAPKEKSTRPILSGTADDQWQACLLSNPGSNAFDRVRSARRYQSHSHHHSRPQRRLRQEMDQILNRLPAQGSGSSQHAASSRSQMM